MSSFHDPAFHDSAAARRFPGPDYHEVLGWLHEALQPETYVEIGVMGGGSLRIARPSTTAVGIDPEAPGSGGTRALIFSMTSGEFFARYDLREVLGGRNVDFALIDGLHRCEQALEDFLNLERYAGPDTVIALHDTIPLDQETSARERTTEFYTGDVWRMVAYLRENRPDLRIVTVKTAPTGLTLVRGFSSGAAPLVRGSATDTAFEWDYFLQHHAEFLGLVPNDRAAVASFCQKTPVQSIRSNGVRMPSRSR
jgi:hypothetical protein